MSLLNSHVIPRGPAGAARVQKGASDKHKVEFVDSQIPKGILKKAPIIKEVAEHKPRKGILKKTFYSSSEEGSSEASASSPLKNSTSSSLVEVLGTSGVREMMPLAEVDPAVCVVGEPIRSDKDSGTDTTEGPTESTEGHGPVTKHGPSGENTDAVVQQAVPKFVLGGCIARTKKMQGSGDTNEQFTLDLSDGEDVKAPPQKQTSEDGAERSVVDEAKSLLEFYLDDKTALRDELLVKQIRRWSGWISLNFMATYGRLRTLTGSHTAVDILRQAVKASAVLELSDDETKVRRLIPFPNYDETFASRAVVQLHQEMPKSNSQIFDVFRMFGQVYAIYVLPRMFCVPCALPEAPEIVVTNVRKFLSRNPALLEVEWKALAFVEFASHREAETALFVLTRMAFRGSGCGGPGLPVLLPVKPHPQMHLKLHDPQEVGELTRVLGLALQADEDRKQTNELQLLQRSADDRQRYGYDPDISHEDDSRLCPRRVTGKAFKETMARDPAIVDCGLPVIGPRAHRESASAFELRAVQVARQRVAWEPCVACQLQERGLYDPIAHAFTLRYSTDKDVKKSQETALAEEVTDSEN